MTLGSQIRFSYDSSGTPGLVAETDVAMFYGLGLLHGRHRPLQALLLAAAGRGRLAAHLLPRRDLIRIDAMVHRLDIPRRASREVERLSPWAKERIDAYVLGFAEGLRRSFELTLLFASIPPPDATAILGGFMVSAYLGLAEGQERMERAIVDAVAHGAKPRVLEAMFSPHLEGWDPAMRFSPAGLGFAAHGMTASAGSNAWAVDGGRTRSSRPMLAGDPHLAIHQLPSLFFEVRLAARGNYFLGASIPGLPGIAIGRTKHIAWSGTFGVADNVDHFIEDRASDLMVRRREAIERRFLPPVELEFLDSERGTLDGDPEGGAVLSTAWAGKENVAESIEAYLRLLFAETADEAVSILDRASTLSLHFVIADRATVRRRENGRVPERTGQWSGLYPVPAWGDRRWAGCLEGAKLARSGPVDGIVATANEAVLTSDGSALSTLAQPRYRLDRIRSLLASRRDHDVDSFALIQLDLYSLQAERFVPRFVEHLADGPFRSALSTWDRSFGVESRGACAFSIGYRAALSALSTDLGGPWFEAMLEDSELPVWWCHALDRALEGIDGERLTRALAPLTDLRPPPLSERQEVTHRNLILGGLPGVDRGPFPLPGSIGTICQGTTMKIAGSRAVVAPAYRFITDMAEDAAYSTLPGGIDGSPFDVSYDRWLRDHHAGTYHRLDPPRGE